MLYLLGTVYGPWMVTFNLAKADRIVTVHRIIATHETLSVWRVATAISRGSKYASRRLDKLIIGLHRNLRCLSDLRLALLRFRFDFD